MIRLTATLWLALLSSGAIAKLIPVEQRVTEYSLNTYLKSCSEALKTPLEAFPKIDCTLGGQVQIYKHGEKLENGEEARQGDTCDNPSLIENYRSACLPNSRIGTVYTESKKLQWSYLCRQFFPTAEGNKRADVVGLIVNNRENGATCFFESKSVGKIDPEFLKEGAINGANIPLLQVDKGEKFWKNPRELVTSSGSDCVNCHAAVPFIRTPYLRKMTKTGPQAVLPENTDMLGKFLKNYWVVADKKLEKLNPRRGWTATFMNPTNPSTRSCTGCHQIGNGHYCSGILPYAIGEEHRGAWKPRTLIKKDWPLSNLHWSEFETKLKYYGDRAEWESSRFYQAVLEIQDCCTKYASDQVNCQWIKNRAP